MVWKESRWEATNKLDSMSTQGFVKDSEGLFHLSKVSYEVANF